MQSGKDNERVLMLALILSIGLALVGSLDVAYADDEGGFGERERDHDGLGFLGEEDDGERGGFLGTGISSLVLAGTIAAILGVGAYAGYKLLKIRQKKSAVAKGNGKSSK